MMLPGAESVRNRHTAPSFSKGMAKIEHVVSDSARRFKRLPSKAKCVLGLSLVLSVLLFYSIARYMLAEDKLTQEEFLETTKCPACYGDQACGPLFHGRVKFSGMSKLRFLDFVNLKNVHFGYHEDRDVVLKKLAHSKELQDVDDWICEDANRDKGCDVARVFHLTTYSGAFKNSPLEPIHLKDLKGDMFRCGSFRLLDRTWKYYQEKSRSPGYIPLKDKLQFVYTLKVNSEPILMQTFPSSEGWPFPEYYGACGRFIMVENVGHPLDEFINAPFEKRADIAYQILKIAEQLTNAPDHYALYWTDLSMENLAVDPAGKVRIIDLENIFVVDKMAIEIRKPVGWNEFLESRFDDCQGKNCLLFSTEELCTRVQTDHNYYAVCRNLLSQYASEASMKSGLLHSMPETARDLWDLENLLNECARPQTHQGRLKVKEKLLQALDNLRNGGSPQQSPLSHKKLTVEDQM